MQVRAFERYIPLSLVQMNSLIISIIYFCFPEEPTRLCFHKRHKSIFGNSIILTRKKGLVALFLLSFG